MDGLKAILADLEPGEEEQLEERIRHLVGDNFRLAELAEKHIQLYKTTGIPEAMPIQLTQFGVCIEYILAEGISRDQFDDVMKEMIENPKYRAALRALYHQVNCLEHQADPYPDGV